MVFCYLPRKHAGLSPAVCSGVPGYRRGSALCSQILQATRKFLFRGKAPHRRQRLEQTCAIAHLCQTTVAHGQNAGIRFASDESPCPLLEHDGRFGQKVFLEGAFALGFETMGARFHGLYLPPPSRPDKPLAVKTLIVPTQEYAEGRSVILTTGRSVYTVALRHLVEQRADWSWAAIQIVEKKSRV